MKILPEYFDSSQFIQPNFNHHFTIKRPYANYAKDIQVKFEDYYTNLKLQCVVFDRIWETCLNMFGVDKAVKKARCFETKNYFDQCITINSFIAKDKKYFPHRYATSEYFHVEPHYDYIHAEPGFLDYKS